MKRKLVAVIALALMSTGCSQVFLGYAASHGYLKADGGQVGACIGVPFLGKGICLTVEDRKNIKNDQD